MEVEEGVEKDQWVEWGREMEEERNPEENVKLQVVYLRWTKLTER